MVFLPFRHVLRTNTRRLFYISPFYCTVEFQSYPSMKWQPAQFELCVVQQVSSDLASFEMPSKYYHCVPHLKHTNCCSL